VSEIQNTVDELRALLKRLQDEQVEQVMGREKGRARSLAITKLEESIMWLEKAG